MTEHECLLTILAEECAEVAQRVSKALRFGMEEVQPGQPYSNRDRITAELYDLLAVAEMVMVFDSESIYWKALEEKRRKVERYLEYSRECGTVSKEPSPNE